MHHTYEPRNPSTRNWEQHSNVVLSVEVFFHETKRGLLTCEQNVTAVTLIQNKMVGYGILKPDTRRMGEHGEHNGNRHGNSQQYSQKKQSQDPKSNVNSSKKNSWWLFNQ